MLRLLDRPDITRICQVNGTLVSLQSLLWVGALSLVELVLRLHLVEEGAEGIHGLDLLGSILGGGQRLQERIHLPRNSKR